MAADLPDWVKGVSPGGGLLSLSVGVVTPGNVGFSNVVNVAGYTELWLTTVATNGAGTARLVLSFYADQAATKPTSPGMVWFKNSRVATYMVVPVLGPWVQLEYDNNDVVNTTAGGSAFAVATPFGIDVADVIGHDPILDIQGDPIAAQATNSYLPSKITQGPMHLWSQINTQPGQVLIQYWTGTAWHFIDLANFTASTDARIDFVAPLSDWRVQVANQGAAAASAFAACVPGEA